MQNVHLFIPLNTWKLSVAIFQMRRPGHKVDNDNPGFAVYFRLSNWPSATIRPNERVSLPSNWLRGDTALS